MTSFEQFAAELRAFSDKKVVLNQLRKDIREPVPELRKEVRQSAIASLPASGGFGAWVARAALTVRVKDSGRAAGIRLKLSRKAGDGDKAELDKLDRQGQIRHPLRGNRKFWYDQAVAAGFFTKVWERSADRWYKVADDALDKALEVIRRG